MSKLSMNIAFCVNDAYVDKLAVVMFSILKNHPATDVHFYIFSSDITKESQEYLEKLKVFHDFELYVKLVDKEDFEAFPLNIDYIKRECYFRYKLADWLPGVDKILYMDADIVVNGDFSAFYKMCLKNNYIAGTSDLFITEKGYHKKFQLDKYINTGVLLMNLKKFRQDKVGDKLIQKTLELKDKIFYQDQDVMNIVCSGKILLVDSIYNFTSRNMRREKSKRKQACVIHYTGPKKPWMKVRTNMKNVWTRYAKEARRILNPPKSWWRRLLGWA